MIAISIILTILGVGAFVLAFLAILGIIRKYKKGINAIFLLVTALTSVASLCSIGSKYNIFDASYGVPFFALLIACIDMLLLLYVIGFLVNALK